LLAAAALLSPSPALANGRFPASNQIVVSPSDPNLVLTRATFGLLLSRDGGKSWDWVCEKAVGYGGIEDPFMGLTAKGSLVAGTFSGLSVSLDTGCAWSFMKAELEKQVIIDVVVRPDAPSTVLALTSTYSGEGDAGPVYSSRVFVSKDDGATWAPSGAAIDPAVLTETLEVARSDPKRLYVSAVRGSGVASSGVLFVSEDEGATWIERAIPIDPNEERAPYVSAVDPSNPELLYVRTSGPGQNRLLVSSDAGKTWKTAFTGKALQGFALSPDGSKVYVGSPSDGLHLAPRDTLAFTKRSSIQVQCLATHGSTLWACSNEASGFVVGTSQDDGATFAALLHLAGVRGPLSCPSSSTATQCVAEWPDLQRRLGGGGADGGADAGDAGSGAQPPVQGCGCTTTPAAPGAALLALSIAALTLALRRRSP
jgi:MYXO-CTERM domain-containing protein